MTKLLKQEQQKKETLFSSFCRFWQYLLDYIICIYMLLIIVVLPFYNEEGYQHIAQIFQSMLYLYGVCFVSGFGVLSDLQMYPVLERRKRKLEGSCEIGTAQPEYNGFFCTSLWKQPGDILSMHSIQGICKMGSSRVVYGAYSATCSGSNVFLHIPIMEKERLDVLAFFAGFCSDFCVGISESIWNIPH